MTAHLTAWVLVFATSSPSESRGGEKELVSFDVPRAMAPRPVASARPCLGADARPLPQRQAESRSGAVGAHCRGGPLAGLEMTARK